MTHIDDEGPSAPQDIEFCSKTLALLIVAPHHQGGHSRSGKKIANALQIPFPINMENLKARAKQLFYDTKELWPWYYAKHK